MITDGKARLSVGELKKDLAERKKLLERLPLGQLKKWVKEEKDLAVAELQAGESVIDLGSGSGMDCFYAAQQVGESGVVRGIDMTDGQLEKARTLRNESGLSQVAFSKSYIEELPFEDESFDCVVSNGVINLVSDKEAVFREAYRVLKPGGRLAISDIVTAVHLPESVSCDVNLWAACIGGAMHREEYQDAITAAGFTVRLLQLNRQYGFKPGRAQRATEKFQVSSISLYATKDA